MIVRLDLVVPPLRSICCFREVSEEFSKDIFKLTSEQNNVSLLKGKELEHCTQLSADLDDLNVQLESRIERLNVSLYNFQHVSSTFRVECAYTNSFDLF